MAETQDQPISELEPQQESTGRHAVYDDTLQRFVGPVHETKSDATSWRKDHAVEGHSYSYRQV